MMGTALWRTGRPEESLRHYEKAIALDPARAESHYSLSVALFLQARYAEAIPAFRRAFEIAPRWGRLPETYDAGAALRLPGPAASVAQVAGQRLRESPGDVAALLVLAAVRATAREASLRDAAEAERLARRACTLTRFQVPEALDVLAAAYAAGGRFEAAVPLQEHVVWYARAAERERLVAGAEARLMLYRQGAAFTRSE
jgi:tetratricopeptide (TPR) repeat protein